MILLDTNVISELMRPEPSPGVVSWVNIKPMTSLFITTITQAEILYGVRLLPEGQRKSKLLAEAQSMFSEDFSGRILPFDFNAAQAYAEIASARRSSGRPISQFDAQIAGIARSRGSRLATRNVDDFIDCGIKVINPWQKRKSG